MLRVMAVGVYGEAVESESMRWLEGGCALVNSTCGGTVF